MRYNTDINRISNDAAVPLTLRVKSKPVRRSAMPDSTPLKRCSKCKAEYPATPEYFSRQSASKDGLHTLCKPCKNTSNRNWYDNNRDERGIQMREYYQNHKDDYRDRKRRNYRNNSRHYLDSVIAWRHRNIDRARLLNRRKMETYRKNNPDAIKARSQKYRAKLKADSFTSIDWRSCLSYWNHCCAACGRPAGLWHQIVPDHWMPLAKGGSNQADNIVPLCHGVDGCNNRKGYALPDEWLIKQFGESKAKSIKNRVEKYFKLIKQKGEK